jgi:hypothetical protein
MSARLLRFALVLGLTVPAAGCALTHATPPAVSVEAAISSVTLGEDCDAARRAEPTGLIAGDCAEDSDGCGGWCQQTAVQLHLVAAASETPDTVPVEVMSVRLSLRGGAVVAVLSPHELSIWDDTTGTYVPWDGTITAGEDLEISVPTTAPDWTAIGGGEPWSTYGMQFEVDLTLRVDGTDRELEYAPAMREPEIVT